MNNNHQNSNYLYNYYDSNYYHSFNQTNDNRFDSLYENENHLNSYQNFDYKIASNIASNYRQCGNEWQTNWGYPSIAHNSYYEPNYTYNHLEPLNACNQTLHSEVESYHNHFAYNQIQNDNYLEKSDKGLETVLKPSFDHLIPVTVHEVEHQIKTEKEIDEIICDERHEQQMDCFQIRQEILQFGDNSCGQLIEHKENDDFNNYNVIEVKTNAKPQRIRRKNRRLMSFEELKRQKRESNRLAATKCRQKKLKQLEALNQRSKLLFEENDKLEQRLNEMKAQVYEKKLTFIHHRTNGCLLNAFPN